MTFVRSSLAIQTNQFNVKYVYFQNFARFDGILFLKHCMYKEWRIRLKVIRDHNIYKIAVDRKTLKERSFTPPYYSRDDVKLLTGRLASLSNTLCPEIMEDGVNPCRFDYSGPKEMVWDILLSYFNQDLLILAGVMRKAQVKTFMAPLGQLLWHQALLQLIDSLAPSLMGMLATETLVWLFSSVSALLATIIE